MSNWIQISERLPTREDADETGEVVWKWKDGTLLTAPFDDRDNSDDAPVAWLPIPKYAPPKPGPTDEECAELLEREAGIGARIAEPTKHWNDEAFALWNLSVRRWFADVTARIEKEKGK